MSELVVFTARENFDFLKFPYWYPTKQKEEIKTECLKVHQTQKQTAHAYGVLALRLAYLRDIGIWEDILNPETGIAFGKTGFGAFCKHAFGLSETATSNLTKVAQFIQSYGDNVGELDEQYRGYSFSQLVELSSVSPSNRGYFNPDMTVKEMRTAKNYMKMGGFFEDKNNADFDLLTYSTAFEEERKLGAGAKKTSPEVIPGQIDLEDISDSVKMDVIPTSELANAGERVLTEEEREEVIKSILLFEPWRDKRKRLYEKYKGNCSMGGFLLEVKTEYLFEGCSTNDGWAMKSNSKGFVISTLFDEEYEFFLAWEQIASRIVTLINRGEYYSEDDERIEQAREAAHKAGIPFYEGNAEEFNPYVYDGKMSVEDYKLMHEQMDADKQSDEYDELDEAQADMQADMQTIEEESERSLPQAKSPIKEYDFSTRDNIRLFLNDYENWYYRDDIRTPFTKYCYWITLPNHDMVYAFEMNVATGATLEGKQEHATEVEYFIFLLSQYYYKEMPDVFKITKRDLEGYLMAHRDELKRR